MAADTFTTPGTFNWTCPAGVFSVQVECWGGGGGGGQESFGFVGGGGGGGGYSRKNAQATTPGTNYAYKVGAGGNLNAAGQSSTFLTSVVVANGGNGGGAASGSGNGSGAPTSGFGTGDVRWQGGDGGSGAIIGGGGGGSGGTATNGRPGFAGDDPNQAGSGGAAVAGGGGGGAGGSSGTGGNPQSGLAPGGGGGGQASGAFQNGVGAAGKVVFTYTVAPACATPTFSPAAGTYTGTQSVTISSTTPGCTFRYTTDGSTPTSSFGTIGSVASIPVSCTLRAVAYKAGNQDSAVGAAAYTILPCATPTFSPAAGTYTTVLSVTISSSTPGCSFRYTTDGSTPSSSAGTPGNVASIPASCTLRAVAYQAGFQDSAVGAAAYTINLPVAATPTFSPGQASYNFAQTVTISSTAGATIRWTVDGSTPSRTVGNVGNTVSIGVTTWLRAIAYYPGVYQDSAVGESSYWLVCANPQFTPGGGVYTAPVGVTISSPTPNCAFRNTLDGSTPTSSVGTPGNTVGIYASATLQAIAYQSGWYDSGVPAAGYTIQTPCGDPGFSPGAGTYTAPQSVTLSSATPGCSFRWTTDGSVPTSAAGNPGSVAAVNASCTLRAIAYQAGYNDSNVSAAAYTIQTPCAAPTFAPGAGTYTTPQTVTLSSATPGCTFRWTTDGSTPTSSVGNIGASVPVNASCTVRAIAYQAGYNDSAVSAAAYTIQTPCATPTFSPVAGTYAGTRAVTISSATPGCTFRYTTDGSTPTSSYGTIGSVAAIGSNVTLRAIAYQAGYNDSAVASAAYTILRGGSQGIIAG